ncbi:uncharacterized protein LOC129963946 [Argiope bruennichi]|uniref:Uncharacterized protein n=1 Tax=Argiope bruennichi TaxID=94029 RepID=A0A8T0EXY6_ARGBR|nr:uncharacterized protein LOC129963946 [Argiope bruennichi]KAF8781478.1 hypothetical protein HNY73_011869 [Argiope bruennichi]
MAMLSLYAICIQKTISLLKQGEFDSSPQNPFSWLAPVILDDLLRYFLFLPHRERPRIADLRLLFTSGRLRHMNLSVFKIDEDQDLLLTLLTEKSCKLLKSITVPKSIKSDIIEGILLLSPNLELIHSAVKFNLQILENNKKLRILKLHLSTRVVSELFSQNKADVLHSLPNLQSLSFCEQSDYFSSWKEIASILKNCPHLVSIGYADSSMAIQEMQRTNLQLNMRRCLWGSKFWNLNWNLKSLLLPLGKEVLPHIIKKAVSSCKLVEELFMVVSHGDCLQYLAELKKLILLSVSFTNTSVDCMPIFISLLNDIGHQLKHVFIQHIERTAVDILLIKCPNLISLRINGPVFVSDTTTRIPSSILLKRLRLSITDDKTLLFLLPRCLYLRELYLDFAPNLNDDLLFRIFNQNSFLQLQIASICDCKLSSRGLRLFLKAAISLKKVSFCPFGAIVTSIINKCNLQIVNCRAYSLQKKEFFHLKFSSCHF